MEDNALTAPWLVVGSYVIIETVGRAHRPESTRGTLRQCMYLRRVRYQLLAACIYLPMANRWCHAQRRGRTTASNLYKTWLRKLFRPPAVGCVASRLLTLSLHRCCRLLSRSMLSFLCSISLPSPSSPSSTSSTLATLSTSPSKPKVRSKWMLTSAREADDD